MRSDQDLLQEYARTRSPEAFAEIVSRHGAAVYRACLRVLRQPQDAEDATQAVFAVLAERPGVVRVPLAAWLHGAARRTAGNLIRGRVRRRERERLAVNDPSPDPEALRAQLDEALGKIPERFREAVVLRFLEDRPEKECADLMGCPQGTVSWRATEGLTRLRSVLANRGLVVGVAALASILAKEAAAAAPVECLKTAAMLGSGMTLAGPPAVLAKGLAKSFALVKMKIAAAVLATVGVAGAGAYQLRPEPEAWTLSPDGFARLHALYRPRPGESAWASVPWETDVASARRRAAAEGKPLFVMGASWGLTRSMTGGAVELRQRMTPELVRRVREECVPLLVDERSAPFAKDLPYLNGASAGVVAPSGKLLGTFDALDDALKKWSGLPESERQAAVEAPAAPASAKSALVLVAYWHYYEANGDRLKIGPFLHPPYRSEPYREFFWATDEEAKALVPREPVKGARHPVPDSLARRLWRFHAVDFVRTGVQYWLPDELRSHRLGVVVEEVAPVVRLRLEGAAAMEATRRVPGTDDRRRTEATLLGFVDYDPRRAAFTRFDAVIVADHDADSVRSPDWGVAGRVRMGVSLELAPVEVLPYTARVLPTGMWLELQSAHPPPAYFE